MFGFFEPIMPAMGFYSMPVTPMVIGLPNAVSTTTYTFGESGFSYSSSSSMNLSTGVNWYASVWRPFMPIVVGPVVPFLFFDPMMAYYWMFMQPQTTMAAGPAQPPPPQMTPPPPSVSADEPVRHRRSRDAEDDGDKPAAKAAEPAPATPPAAPAARRGGGGGRRRTPTARERAAIDELMQKAQAVGGDLRKMEPADAARLQACVRTYPKLFNRGSAAGSGGTGGDAPAGGAAAGNPPPPAAAGTGGAGAAGDAPPPAAAPREPNSSQKMVFDGVLGEMMRGKKPEDIDPKLMKVFNQVARDYPEWARARAAELQRQAQGH